MNTTRSYDDDNTITGDPTLSTSSASTTIAALFAERDRARDAVHRLHDEGFRDTWIGITKRDDASDYLATATRPVSDNPSETRIEAENWFTRFFGEGDESLHDALVRHGVSEMDARAVGNLPASNALLTVDGENHPELAAQVISQNGGQLITRGFGATGYGTSGTYGSADYGTPGSSDAAKYERANGYGAGSHGTSGADAVNGDVSDAPTARTTSLYDEGAADQGTIADRTAERDRDFAAGSTGFQPETVTREPVDSRPDFVRNTTPSADVSDARDRDAAKYDDYGRFRAGAPVDESTRLQLREERLRIDKSRVSRGEAAVGIDVVTETQDIDVPLVREELFIERRPASGSTVDSAKPFGQNETIRIPLSEEKVSVSKVPIITEEVVVGKRQVEDTQHITETTRKEQLDVATRAGNASDR